MARSGFTDCTSGAPMSRSAGLSIDAKSAATVKNSGINAIEPAESVPHHDQDQERDNESSELYDLANSILEECKQTVQTSSLNKLFVLFHEALFRRPPPHPRRSESLKNVAMALLAIFHQTAQLQDLDYAICLCIESSDAQTSSGHAVRTQDEASGSSDSVASGDQEASEMTDLALATLTQFHQSAQVSSIQTAILLHRDALLLRPAPHIYRRDSLHMLADALVARFYHTGIIQDLDEAILLRQEALRLRPGLHPDQLPLLINLSAVLVTRFTKTGQSLDLHQGVSLRSVASKLGLPMDRVPATESHVRSRGGAVPKQAQTVAIKDEEMFFLSDFATSLCEDFSKGRQLLDLHAAISMYRDVLVRLPTQCHHRSSVLNDLTSALSMRFDRTCQLSDLEEAVVLHRSALKLRPAPHVDRSASLYNLANALHKRFDQTGQPVDLEEAIVLYRKALELFPAPHPDRPQSINNLALALNTSFHQTGQVINLEEANVLLHEALELVPTPHPERPSLLNTLAHSLSKLFGHTGQITNLNQAVLLLGEGLELMPVSHSNRWDSLSNLASLIAERFDQTGELVDLNKAVSLLHEALELIPALHPGRSKLLSNLASTLGTRFDQTGEILDLEEAVALHREALELTSASNPKRSTFLRNLANTLFTRFGQTDQQADLDEAITLNGEALKLTPALHSDRSESLTNLASTLSTRFIQTGQILDLNEAVALHREAIGLWPALHPHRSGSLDNLANTLSQQFSQTGQIGDLDEAIELHRKALELRPAPHSRRSDSLHNLASDLGKRYSQTHQLPDIEEAIMLLRDSLSMLPQGHPKNCTTSHQLGMFFMHMHSQTQKPEYLEDAMAMFRAAVCCVTAPASKRFEASQTWAHYADSVNHDSALEAYQAAIQLLPRLATLGLDLLSRHKALTAGSDGLARSAAACAIRYGQFDKAVELLEEGRSIFWSQASQLRVPLDDLQLTAPEAVQKLKRISRALEQGSLRDSARSVSDTSQQVMSMEQETARYRRLNDDWLTTLEEVRSLDGFGDFLRPKPLTTLLRVAANDPVVILIASDSSCAALILTSSGVRHFPLPKFTLMIAQGLVALIRSATQSGASDHLLSEAVHMQVEALTQHAWTHESDVIPTEPRHGKLHSAFSMDADSIFSLVLQTLWKSLVEPVIRSLSLEKSESPPRLWWCPTGLFAFLPIHAAGIYDTDGENASDYIVSSYTPTLSALLAPKPLTASTFKMMVVIQPKTLPYAREELNRIEKHVPSGCLVKLGIPQAPATVQHVTSHLSGASVVHFACHGVQDARNPLQSAVILEDDRLTVSQIMRQPMPNACLAFLSACQTAMGDGKLPDEAIHLAAAMLFAGFRGVVATMWSMSDMDGPKIADAFYGHLFQTNQFAISDAPHPFPDTNDAARALHLAVIKLRRDKCSFVRWVPFIHLGL